MIRGMGRMHSRINVPAHTHHRYAPWCIPESWHVRACVRDLGGRSSNARVWPVHYARLWIACDVACDDGRWRRQADLRRELRCLVCLNLRKPSHAAFRGSVHEAGRRPLLSCTTACLARTVLELYVTYHTCCWMACIQSQETRTMHRVASAHTLNQRCAATIMQMRRMALRGTEGVLKGTQGVLGCWMECVQAHRTRTMHRAA